MISSPTAYRHDSAAHSCFATPREADGLAATIAPTLFFGQPHDAHSSIEADTLLTRPSATPTGAAAFGEENDTFQRQLAALRHEDTASTDAAQDVAAHGGASSMQRDHLADAPLFGSGAGMYCD